MLSLNVDIKFFKFFFNFKINIFVVEISNLIFVLFNISCVTIRLISNFNPKITNMATSLNAGKVD